MEHNKELKWLQSLQSFLYRTLKPIIDDDDRRQMYVNQDAMIIWEKAFTHETYSPSNNYEELEFIGDAMLKAAFPKYLREKFPTFTKRDYTELNREYMSKLFQAKLCRDMKLNDYIRVLGMKKANLNLETDVFESFIGGLVETSDQITPGLGFINCYNMIVHLFSAIEIDTEKGIGAVKTQVNQIFNRFDIGEPTASFTDPNTYGITNRIEFSNNFLKILSEYGYQIDDPVVSEEFAETKNKSETKASLLLVETLSDMGIIETSFFETLPKKKFVPEKTSTYQIKLTNKQINFLKNYGFEIDNPVIGKALGFTKKEAEFEAYNNALNNLASLGINTQWAFETKRARDFEDPEIAKYVEKAQERLEKEGYVSMQFFIAKKTTTGKGVIIQLFGIKNTGQKEVLSFVYTPDRENYRAAKIGIIRHYAEGLDREQPVSLPQNVPPFNADTDIPRKTTTQHHLLSQFEQRPVAISQQKQLMRVDTSAHGVVTKPVSPVQKPISPVQKPISPVQKPISPVQKPISPVQRPITSVQKPISPVQRPITSVQKPISPVQMPIIPAQKPISPVQMPITPAQKPISPVQRPITPAQKQISPVQSPITLVQKPISPVQKTISPVQRPITSVQRPITPVQMPITPAQKPISPVVKSGTMQIPAVQRPSIQKPNILLPSSAKKNPITINIPKI